MGVFDNVGDIPGQLSSEALQVTLKFEPGVPAAGQGTISWNIPVSSSSISGSPGPLAYAGIVIVVSDQPVAMQNIPRNGIAYTADPTFDPDKFSGERIGNARVIGYIYEPEVVANAGVLTTSIVVADLDLAKNYYIAGYILDAQRRYDQNGSRAYSDMLGHKDQPGTRANQTILLGFNSQNFTSGVLPTDGTNLVAGATYQFQVIYDSGYPQGRDTVRNMLISFDGSIAGTYGDMVKEINRQMAIQCHRGTYVSPVPPGAGIYYWDGQGQLWLWNGSTLTAVPNVIIQNTDPTLIAVGTYWYKPITNTLYQWDGSAWVVVPTIDSPYDPTNPPPGSWWWDGTNAFSRCGNAWCEVAANETFISTTDPSCPAQPVTCAFWYDPATQALQTYNGTQWVPAYAVTWPVAPNAIALGSYWFDLTNNTLFTRALSGQISTVGNITTGNGSGSIVSTNSTTAGVGYTSGQYTNVPLTGGSGTGARATITVGPAGSLSTFQTIIAGTLYVDGVYTNVPLTGGSGTGALATIAVVGGGVASVAITTPGTGYIQGDVLSASTVTLGGGSGSGFVAIVYTTISNVTSVVITNPGTGYFIADILSANALTLGGIGSGFTTTVSSIHNYINGVYTNVPLTGSSGTGAQATITVSSGVVSSVIITNPGTGYVVGEVLTTSASYLGGIGSGFTVSVLTVASPTSGWAIQSFINSPTDPALVPANAVIAGTLWYNPTTEILNTRNGTNTAWVATPVLVWPTDPTDIVSCSLWFDDSGSSPGVLKEWDIVNNIWVPVTPYFNQTSDPFGPPTIPTGAVWFNPTTGVLSIWTGNTWEVLAFINFPTDPTAPANGTAWYNTATGVWSVWNTPNPGWNVITPTISNTAPNSLAVGQLWFDTAIPNHLYQWDGTKWVELPFTTVKPVLKKGQVWYDSTNNKLLQWDGSMWTYILPCVCAKFDRLGNLVFETTYAGSNQVVMVPVPAEIPWMASGLITYGTGAADYINDSISPNAFYAYGTQGNSLFEVPIAGNYYNGLFAGLDYFGDFSGNIGNGMGPVDCWVDYPGDVKPIPYRALPINPNAYLWSNLKPTANVLLPYAGQDGVSGTPTYNQLGVGTDGSPDERRNIMGIVRTQLGYPTVTVELTDDQLNRCVQNALESFRQRSSMAIQRVCFFLDIQPYNQHYKLTNKAVGFNKVVEVMAGYRFTSAFLSQAMGAGVYGQVVMQHLYNMGTFDLLSYHIVSQYVEQLELMFATRLTFTWNANTRELRFFQSFTRPERILLDATIEKTEQEIFLDRYAKRWIQQYALAEAMDILAQIRGKYASLPGAGGGVTLNALDLRTQAKDIRDQCQSDLDELIVQDVESYGAYGSIVMG